MKKILPTSIRIPTYLKDWIKERATGNSRSVNGELVEIMKKVREQEETKKE